MHRFTWYFVTAILLCSTLFPLEGCQMFRKKLGIVTEVSDPSPGSPEWVIMEAIKAAMEKDEPKAWATFRTLLHSKELNSPASEKNWRQMNFQTFRRKVKLYTEDDMRPYYKLHYLESDNNGHTKVYVHNEKSDMPTPCKVAPDPKANGAWKITLCSL
jgi:hypothetical protein